MTLLFNLTVPPDRSRSGVDALLELDELEKPLPFELKSSTRESISTVRDFGPEHIAKWKKLHWLFAFYDREASRARVCYYASPADMADWINDKERYVRPDLVLANSAPQLISSDLLTQVLGPGDTFTADDARRIMKMQWSSQQYRDGADLPGQLYSRGRMIELLRERCAYVIRRGATLNNPHIPGSYLSSRLEAITRDHAATLRRLVRSYLADREARLVAGETPQEDCLDPVVAAQAGTGEPGESPG